MGSGMDKGKGLTVTRKLVIEPEREPVPVSRRDFLYVATGVVAAVGAVASIYPMIDQMEPDASTLAAGGPVDFDLSALQPGQQVVVRWRSRPVFILNRPPAALQMLQDPKLVDELSDAKSRVMQQPPYAENWHRSIKPEHGLLVGICTHLGCIPTFYPDRSDSLPTTGWLGGYFCPCHGSKYDLAGRVYSSVPAPYNLPVPPYRYLSDTAVRIGENPPDVAWEFNSIVQI